MKRIILILLVLTTNLSFAQKSDFPEWGKFSNYEKNLTVYEKDNSAHAVVLDEVGYAYVESGGDYNIILKVYRKIKILDKEGVNQANIRKKIYKKNELKKIVGTTTNFVNGKAVVTKLSKSQVFTEKVSEDYKTVTFTLPNVKVGSIIEYSYKIRTPFHHTFAGGWTFQNSIPTLKSSYFAKIPGFWNYHISTKGISNPQFQQNTLIKDCISVNSTVAECLFLNLASMIFRLLLKKILLPALIIF